MMMSLTVFRFNKERFDSDQVFIPTRDADLRKLLMTVKADNSGTENEKLAEDPNEIVQSTS